MSRLLVLAEHDVHRLLTMPDCIRLMREALTSLGRGEVFQPLRQAIRPPEAPGLLGLMPAYRGGSHPYYGLKEVCVFPGNPAVGLDTHLGGVLLHDGTTGELLAVVNAAAVTAIRTAAVSAVATDLLARPESSVLAILGAGAQGRSHLAAIPLVRPITEIRICSRSRARAAELARLDGRARIVETPAEALEGADVVVTATSAKEPIVRKSWVAPGTHLNAVGSSVRTARELDGELLAAASIFVDRRESTLNESGDFLTAVSEGWVTPDDLRAELGEILTGRAPARTGPAEITIFKSLGLAIEDLAAAAWLFERAKQDGAGSWVEF